MLAPGCASHSLSHLLYLFCTPVVDLETQAFGRQNSNMLMMISMQGPAEEEQDEDKERPLPLLPTLKALQAAWQAASKQTALKQAPSMAKALQESLQPGAQAEMLAKHMQLSVRLQHSMCCIVFRPIFDVSIFELHSNRLCTCASVCTMCLGHSYHVCTACSINCG